MQKMIKPHQPGQNHKLHTSAIFYMIHLNLSFVTTRPIRLVLTLAALLTLQSCSGCYLARQGRYLFSHILSATPVDKLLQDTGLDQPTRDFLILCQDVRRFAVDSLGLATNRNYTTYVSLDKDHLVDVVCASLPDTFDLYQWRYPFFGAFPYRGYYRLQDAHHEAKRLEQLGYETWVRPAGAFSTLGILTDPLFSFMQRYSLFSKVSLIIHEQTHATVFIRNKVNFNEELATFVGDEGAMRYISWRYGPNSKEELDARNSRNDYRAFTSSLTLLHDRLDSLYRCNNDSISTIAERTQIIDAFKVKFDRSYDTAFATPRYRKLSSMTINNAYILSHMTYAEDLPLFDSLLSRSGGNLRACVARLKTLEKHRSDPISGLAALVTDTK